MVTSGIDWTALISLALRHGVTPALLTAFLGYLFVVVGLLVDLGRPAYKLGIAELRVGWKAHELRVSVSADKPVYKVRSRANVSVSVKKADGLPPPAGTEVAVAAVRGAFEFQGQKCSAASRMYVPKSRWNDIRDRMVAMMKEIKVGDVRDFRNFMGAVIDKKAFDKISEYLADAKKNAKVVQGGGCKGDEGYFIEPTLIETTDPSYRLMCEEIFGPVLTVYVYEDAKWSEMLDLVDRTSPYALTGAVFARDRAAVIEAMSALRNAAGNFYINDKPTGAVVGQQPFGGARASGTNDKAGSKMNLMRWVSARTIKETFAPPTDFKYPFMAEE